MFKSWNRLYPGQTYRYQPADYLQYEAPTELEVVIQRHTAMYPDPRTRAWLERQLRAWAKERE